MMTAPVRKNMKFHRVARSAIRGVLPFQSLLRRAKRYVRPYEDNAANSDYCITQGLQQITALKEAFFPIEGAEVLEFGTGWLPLIPILFHLAGARKLILTDVARLMDEQTIARAKRIVSKRLDDVARVIRADERTLLARLDEPWTYDYRAPWNAVTHPPASVDLIISRAVFEHVPPRQLYFFLAQFARILRPTGAMSHVIDNSDHWQHADRELSRVNFLRYPENNWFWKLAQINQQSYQNRLRHSDYRQLFLEAGFEIVRMGGTADASCLEDLTHMSIASQFADIPHTDLAVLESLFILTRTGQDPCVQSLHASVGESPKESQAVWSGTTPRHQPR